MAGAYANNGFRQQTLYRLSEASMCLRLDRRMMLKVGDEIETDVFVTFGAPQERAHLSLAQEPQQITPAAVKA